MRRLFIVLPLLLLLSAMQRPEVNLASMTAPAGIGVTINSPAGAVLPNGRRLTPRGRQIKVAAHPYGLALSPNGRTLIASCNGTEPFAISIIDDLQKDTPQLKQIEADSERYRGSKIPDEDDDEFRSVFMGLAVAPDNRTLYASSGNQGSIFIFDLIEGTRQATIRLNDVNHRNSFIGAIQMTKDGRRLYALDQANYRVAVIDTAGRKVIESKPTGRAPFSLALSPDELTLYVTNVGIFKYSLVGGYDPRNPKKTGLSFPPFGYLSDAMKKGGTFEGKRVAGLGDPNSDEAASVWTYKIASSGGITLDTMTKTGRLIGSTANGIRVVGGSSPSGVVAGRNYAFISNANNDSVTVIDRTNNRIRATIDLNILNEAMKDWRKRGYRIPSRTAETIARLRGQIPFGLALSRDERRLYVAEAGINAIAVIDVEKLTVLGHIPTGWFPSQLALSDDGKQLYVASAKGFGSGPNGGPKFTPGPEGSYVGALQKGVISIITIPAERELAAETSQVIKNNGFDLNLQRDASVVIPNEFGSPSEKIKYVVFITKENRTYDQVYGDIVEDSTGRQLHAEPALATYGERANVFDKDNRIALREVNVTPNHHALAREFAFGDNFYLDSDVSADGHRWLVGVYPNAWVETSLAAAYGGHREFRTSGNSPGRLTFTGSSSSIHPEDYLESGSIWEHLHRAHLSFRNYGEGFELGGVEQDADFEPSGARESVNYPIPQPLFDNTARNYPTYNMNISDQYRLQQFELDFKSRFIDGKQPLPRFINIYLPNDHTARERPEDGYPYRASFVADNDYAMGKIVEFLSHTPYWREMAIIITEDDAQDGRDSIDAHRSLLLVVSPYAKRGYAMQSHTSIASIFKTIYLVLGSQPLNQFDVAAADLKEAFTDEADFTPYKCVEADERIFDPGKVRMISKSRDGERMKLDDPADFIRSHRRQERQGR